MDTQANLLAVELKHSFFHFVFFEKRNSNLILIATVSLIAQFIIFKSLYPFPDFFSDSYSYLFAAYAGLDLNIWPIGYSKFLLAFHDLTYSPFALIAFQYFFLMLSSIYFFLSFIYFYQPSKLNTNLLFIFLFFNPVFLYISNYVNSDPLFAALSLIWFTQLLWIIHRPKKYQIYLQAVLLFLCFTVRSNAYYYPLISVVAFLLSNFKLKLKLLGIFLPFVFIVPFIIHTRNIAYEMTGARQFSILGGWVLANNALYMYQHIKVDSNRLPSAETKALDNLSKNYFKHLRPEFDDYLTAYVANYFIRQPEAPLKQYYSIYFNPNDEYESIEAWGKAAVVFEDYGSYLIKNYPFSFARYFVIRNIRNYFLPPLEKLEVYNLGLDEIYPIAQDWFHFKSKKVSSISKTGQGKLLYLYPMFFFFINLYFLGNILWLLINKKITQIATPLKLYSILISCFLLINFCFSIMATINVFRYQFFPMIICFSFAVLPLGQLDKKGAGHKIISEYAA